MVGVNKEQWVHVESYTPLEGHKDDQGAEASFL